MKMWSQGLGKIELEVDARDMMVVKEDKATKARGVTASPVEWNYVVTLERDDVPAILHIALQWKTIRYLLRNFKYVLMFFVEKLMHRNETETVQEVKAK